jgi:hypothetical protein
MGAYIFSVNRRESAQETDNVIISVLRSLRFARQQFMILYMVILAIITGWDVPEV